MEYKSYKAKIEYDDEARNFHGQIINLRDIITFQGSSVEELHREFEISVNDYLEWCAELGREPEKPFSGKFVVRVEPDLHRRAAISADIAGKSLNAWVSETLTFATRHLVMGRHTTR